MTDYLTIIEIAAIQQDQIERYGGSHGIRDRGALESACYRPQSGYYKDIIEQAAALMESLIMNHPFVDGNKRVAFASAYTFLKINGYEITASSDEIYEFLMDSFDKKDISLEKIKPFFKSNVKLVKS